MTGYPQQGSRIKTGMASVQDFLFEKYCCHKMPDDHIKYLEALKASGFEPKVIYDIGSCFLSWQKEVKRIWPEAEVYCVEATSHFRELYERLQLDNYHIGVVSDEDGKDVTWWESTVNWEGNSYMKEIGAPRSREYYTPDTAFPRKTVTLDSIASTHGWPKPDFLKIDVQGAELDVLRGAPRTLSSVKHMILELARQKFNDGAPLAEEVLPVVEDMGFTCVSERFNKQFADDDYGFKRNDEM